MPALTDPATAYLRKQCGLPTKPATMPSPDPRELTSYPAEAAERVRAALAAAGFPAARIGRTTDYGRSVVAVAGYVVTEGTSGHGPRVQWDQRLTADEMAAKLEEIRDALDEAGLYAEWVEKAWELEVGA